MIEGIILGRDDSLIIGLEIVTVDSDNDSLQNLLEMSLHPWEYPWR